MTKVSILILQVSLTFIAHTCDCWFGLIMSTPNVLLTRFIPIDQPGKLLLLSLLLFDKCSKILTNSWIHKVSYFPMPKETCTLYRRSGKSQMFCFVLFLFEYINSKLAIWLCNVRHMSARVGTTKGPEIKEQRGEYVRYLRSKREMWVDHWS